MRISVTLDCVVTPLHSLFEAYNNEICRPIKKNWFEKAIYIDMFFFGCNLQLVSHLGPNFRLEVAASKASLRSFNPSLRFLGLFDFCSKHTN